MERVFLEHSFGPFYRPDSRLLILGSFPSVKSREANFFYGHPQNRFWPLIARLCGEDTPGTLEEKKALLTRHRIALYDVIERCSVVGSSDSSIRDVVHADLQPILSGSRIGNRIFVNGAKAYTLYQRYLYPELGIPAEKLPSTSPANAACSLDKLTQSWGEKLNPVLGGPNEHISML
ncbi:MAG: DNA-deoxyinosine glycosylase [Oscillospiraceae bacterium]|nr:DNA-deoxyinosine glycosylase [Oscillospiraceae bacterium]